jgi:hypothetical protein
VTYVLVSKCNFSGEYIDSLPAYERNMFYSYYQEEIKSQRVSPQNHANDVNNSIQVSSLPDIGL